MVPKKCLNVCYRKNLGKRDFMKSFRLLTRCFRYVFGVQIPPQQVFGSLGVDLRICFKQGRVFESTSRFVSFDGLGG